MYMSIAVQIKSMLCFHNKTFLSYTILNHGDPRWANVILKFVYLMHNIVSFSSIISSKFSCRIPIRLIN